jgi:hypothetical protein
MKAVVLLSKTFFNGHPKAGQQTDFRDKLLYRLGCRDCQGQGIRDNRFCTGCKRNNIECVPKIHTCRINYEYWEKKIDRLKAVGGVLSIRQWIGRPYHKQPNEPGQETIIGIPAEIVGVQKLTIEYGKQKFIPFVNDKIIHLPELAYNDGLDTYDFINWFKPVFEKEKKEVLDFVIIHFTKFRY